MGKVRFRRVTRCAFCPNKPNSKEHAWPDWILKKLDTSPQQVLGHIEGEEALFDYAQRALKVRCVCENCNTKWMKGLEDSIIPIAGPLIENLPGRLNILQQWMLAN